MQLQSLVIGLFYGMIVVLVAQLCAAVSAESSFTLSTWSLPTLHTMGAGASAMASDLHDRLNLHIAALADLEAQLDELEARVVGLEPLIRGNA